MNSLIKSIKILTKRGKKISKTLINNFIKDLQLNGSFIVKITIINLKHF